MNFRNPSVNRRRIGFWRSVGATDKRKKPSSSPRRIAKSLCDARSCVTIRDGVILYRDDDHLNVGGGKLAAPDFSVAPQPSETGQ